MTKKEYLTKMVEECLDVRVVIYDGSANPVRLRVVSNTGYFTTAINVQVRNHYGLTLNIWDTGGKFYPEDAQKLKDWVIEHGAQITDVTYSSGLRMSLKFKDREYPWKYYTEKKLFKPGTKVRFTQEAKDRFGDSEYWCHANGPNLNLDETYIITVASPDRCSYYELEDKHGHPCKYLFPVYLFETVDNMDSCQVSKELLQDWCLTHLTTHTDWTGTRVETKQKCEYVQEFIDRLWTYIEENSL